jgi:hypothetical protein
MNKSGINIKYLREILPQIPQDYIECAIQDCTESNIFDYVNFLMELNDKYPESFSGPKYKVYQCTIPDCKIPSCPFFHKLQERRRDTEKFAYEPKPCFAVYNGIWNDPVKCKKGDRCEYSHTSKELDFHPKHCQPTNRPQEEGKRNIRNEPSVQNFINKINKYKVEIRELEKDIQEKSIKLQNVDQEIFNLKAMVLCYVCGNDAYDWILPCGHLLCTKCKATVVAQCLLCNQSVGLRDIIELK